MSNPYITKSEGDAYAITPEGEQYLSDLVTDPTGPVYAFKAGSEGVLVAAAMARLSRRGSDLREIYLDEFAHVEGKAEELIERVVTGYGDDSVQQLVGIHMVVEDASNLETKALEWGRLGSYLEQSTRYFFFDRRNRQGKFRFYTPSNLDTHAEASYNRDMNLMFQNYSANVRLVAEHIRKVTPHVGQGGKAAYLAATKAQACDAVRPMLPVATTSTVGIFASAQAIESLILHLASSDLVEFTETAQRLLTEARKVIPAFLERTDLPDRGGATAAYYQANARRMKRLTQDFLVQSRPTRQGAGVELVSYWPHDELEVVARMLFRNSTLSTREIIAQVELCSLDEKVEVIKAYIGERLNRRHKPGRALELLHYEWDAVCDYGIFRDLQRHRMVDRWEWQNLTPNYGYDVPQVVIEAGAEAAYRLNFEISERLYRELEQRGYDEEKQYATLLGHRMRFTYIENWRASLHINELRTTQQGHPEYRALVNQKFEIQSGVHPILSAAMSFVNKDEDPALTRLAGELATERKLALLAGRGTTK